jgi:EpsI family protein
MSGLDRRSLILGGGLLAAGVAGNALRPSPAADAVLAPGTLDRLIPDRLGDYRGAASDQLIQPQIDAAQRRAYSDVLMRQYVAPDQPLVMLVAAAGPRSGPVLGVHEPRLCYLSAGFDFISRASVALHAPAPQGAIARTALAIRQDRSEVLLYWIRIADRFVASPFEQRTMQIASNLRGVQPAARLVRLSMVVRSEAEVDGAVAQLSAFNQSLMQGLSALGRSVVLGVTA